MNYIYVILPLCLLSMLTLATYAAKRPTSVHLRYKLGGRIISAPVAAFSAGAYNMVGWVLRGVQRFISSAIIWSSSIWNGPTLVNITDTFKTVNHQLIQSSP